MRHATTDDRLRSRLWAASAALLILAAAGSCAESGDETSTVEPTPSSRPPSPSPSADDSPDIAQPGVVPSSEEPSTDADASYEPAPDPEHGYEGPSPAPRQTLALGESFDRGAGVLITVREVRTDLPGADRSGLPDGDAWFAIDVEVCMGDTPLSPEYLQSFGDQWTLRTADGETLDWSPVPHDDVIEDQLDLYTTEPRAGQCHRGWVVLDGPADAEPVSAQVAIVEDAEWQVAA